MQVVGTAIFRAQADGSPLLVSGFIPEAYDFVRQGPEATGEATLEELCARRAEAERFGPFGVEFVRR